MSAPNPFAAMRAHYGENPENQTLGERCLISFGNSGGPVMLPLLYNNNYEIAQSKDTVAILVEMVHDVRIIHIGAKHRTDGIRPWFGDSIGRYEGSTLVVETTNFPQVQSFRGAWKELKVTERSRAWGRSGSDINSRSKILRYGTHPGVANMSSAPPPARA